MQLYLMEAGQYFWNRVLTKSKKNYLNVWLVYVCVCVCVCMHMHAIHIMPLHVGDWHGWLEMWNRILTEWKENKLLIINIGLQLRKAFLPQLMQCNLDESVCAYTCVCVCVCVSVYACVLVVNVFFCWCWSFIDVSPSELRVQTWN